MGQLERYGLYVLCLVIFLILGVAIWGGEPAQAKRKAVAEISTQHLKSEEDHVGGLDRFLEEQEQHTLAKQRSAEDLVKDASSDNSADGNERDDVGKKAGSVTPVAPAALRTHKVAPGEILEVISLRYLGNRQLWRKILAINKHVDERRLKPGTVLKIPARSVAKAGRAKDEGVKAARTYKVRKNENPWLIARRHYGTKNVKKYVDAILALNHIPDPRDIKEGVILKLPPR